MSSTIYRHNFDLFIIEKLISEYMAEALPSYVVDVPQETQNCETIFITFLTLVLPVLKIYVLERMVAFCKNQKELLRYNSSEPNHNELAKWFLSSPPMRQNFDTLENCTDCRVLLTIISGADCCFSTELAEIAKKLKETGNITAHTQTIHLNNEYTESVLDAIEKMFEIIPYDTQSQIRDLQQVKKYGAQALLQKRGNQQITAIRKSLQRANSQIQPTLKASIEDSLRGEERSLEKVEVFERNMSKEWPKIPAIETIVCWELDLISLRGNAAGLQSLIATKTPKTKTTTYSGYLFKIYMDPFEKESTRLAFRGRFCSPRQTCHYFRHLADVVVKTSAQLAPQEAFHFQKVHIYANEFAKEWNALRRREELLFLWIVSVKLPGFEGTQTMEPYLDKKQYRKW